MNILRVTTISLVLAVAVFALAYANPSSAGGKTCDPGDSRPKCAADPPAAGLKFTISMDGAFAINNELATSEGDNTLIGDEEFTVVRPALGINCSDLVDGDPNKAACETWSNVFDVCDIYTYFGNDPYGPNAFTAETGKNGWKVYKFTGGVRLFLATSIDSPISPEPLRVTMTFSSECAYSPDGDQSICDPFFPEVPGDSTEFVMDYFSNHARGKKNVAHAQECHANEGELLPQSSTLTITAE